MSIPPEFDDGKEREIAAQKDTLLRQILSPEARMRLGNVRMVRKDLATSVENYLMNMFSQGRIQPPVSDDQLKQILISMQQPRRGFKMNRV